MLEKRVHPIMVQWHATLFFQSLILSVKGVITNMSSSEALPFYTKETPYHTMVSLSTNDIERITKTGTWSGNKHAPILLEDKNVYLVHDHDRHTLHAFIQKYQAHKAQVKPFPILCLLIYTCTLEERHRILDCVQKLKNHNNTIHFIKMEQIFYQRGYRADITIEQVQTLAEWFAAYPHLFNDTPRMKIKPSIAYLQCEHIL